MDPIGDVPMPEAGTEPGNATSNALNSREPTINPAVFALSQPPIEPDPLVPSADVGLIGLQENLNAEPKSIQNPVDVAASDTGASSSPDYASSEETDLEELYYVEMDEPRRHQTVEVVIPAALTPALPYSSSLSGLVYDWRMREHCEPLLQEEEEVHPEDPRRISEIYGALYEAGLVEEPDFDDAKVLNRKRLLWRLPFTVASPEDLSLVHSNEHIKWVKSLITLSNEELAELATTYDSVYLHRTTWMCARLSAGGAIEACRAVVQGKVRNSVAVIRPPGHHAEQEQPGGFCFFDNVAVAAKVCQRDFPETCRKVFVLDWDVHHGNGVQQAFYSDPNVLYISLHVHENGLFYPLGPYGNHLHCGEGPGLGKNVNIPWPKTGMRDGDYLYAFQKVVMPIAAEFDPDLVIIAAGFDAAEGDKLGGCHVTPPAYAHMTHMLMSLAKGKIAVCLEGGYDLAAISASCLAVTKTLMGEPPERIAGRTDPSPAGLYTVDLVMRHQAKYWRCMFPKVPQANLTQGERMHDLIRSWQSQYLYDNYRMSPLFILKEGLSVSFKDQVLATPNYEQSRPLLLILHDPPEVAGIPDPMTNKLELHNILLTDVTKKYIDWAVMNEFAVIDVNVPKHITDPGEMMTGKFIPADDQEKRMEVTRNITHYLWENYIELNDCTHLFLLGIGGAYCGVVDLLSNNPNCSERTTHAISFVCDNPLMAVRRHTDDSFPTWYYSHSTVFISEDHDALDPNRARKPRKKYGHLRPSPHRDLVSMMMEHKNDVTDLLLRYTEAWRDYQAELNRRAVRLKREREDADVGRPGPATVLETSGPFVRPRSAVTSPTAGVAPAIRVDESRSVHASSMRSPTGPLPPMGTFIVGPGSQNNSPKAPSRSRDSRSPSKR